MRKSIERLVALYTRVAQSLKLQEPELPVWSLILAGGAAYALGVYVRLGVAQRSLERIAKGPDGQPMFTTTDAYYYAAGVERALTGLLPDYPRVPDSGENLVVALGALLAKVTGSTVSTVGSWLPIYVAPLFAGVAVLWGVALRLPRIGVLAAFSASIGYSYLNRTSPGQLDTDLVSLSFPYLTLGLALLALSRSNDWAALAAGLLCSAAVYVHPGSARILTISALAIAVYVVLFRRDRVGAWVLLALFLGLMPGPAWLRACMVCAAFALERVPRVSTRVLAIGTSLVALALLVQLASTEYFFLLGARAARSSDKLLHFYDVRPEVTELRAPSAAVMIERVAGNRWLLFLGILGGALLVFTEPLALPLVPLALLGTFGSLKSGIRFTIYAPLVFALGGAYLLSALTDGARVAFPKQQRAWLVAGALFTLAVLTYPAVSYGNTVNKSSAFSPRDARLLGELKAHTKPDSYVLGWWDYGYPIWYYARARSLVDGAKQDDDLFVVAEVMFGDSQLRAAQLARLAVEKSRDHDGAIIRYVFEDAANKGIDGDELLEQLGKPGYPLPPKRGEIYFFAPFRTSGIASMWAKARRVGGLRSREHIETGYIRSGAAMAGTTGKIKLTAGHVLDTKRWVVLTDQGVKTVASTITVRRGADGKIQLTGQMRSPTGTFHVLSLPDRRAVVVVDEVMLRSVYVQLAFFEKVDPRAFEPVIVRPEGAIYRVVL